MKTNHSTSRRQDGSQIQPLRLVQDGDVARCAPLSPERQALIRELERALSLVRRNDSLTGLALILSGDAAPYMRCAGGLTDPNKAVFSLEKMKLGLLVGTTTATTSGVR